LTITVYYGFFAEPQSGNRRDLLFFSHSFGHRACQLNVFTEKNGKEKNDKVARKKKFRHEHSQKVKLCRLRQSDAYILRIFNKFMCKKTLLLGPCYI
jgi:hypothetical protein